MKKLKDTLKSNAEISEQVKFKTTEEDTASRRIFPEDHKTLKRLAFEMDKTIIEVLNDVLKHAQSKKFSVDRYNKYERFRSPIKNHKSVRIPNEMSDFVKEHSKWERASL
ncbi:MULTISPECIES: hypothetical protein [Bacillaceae]|uniref:Uncharacterized protein n=1 Tax=Domibacillus aminovorans TaxID=29332 RepID=A0A177KN61_9BACI|nr:MULTISPECIES: hypothetical protein [Bacillaceae]OAH54011.1 hypothetical protein AWH48_09590 [Domibacillus aminovorans]